MPVKTWPSEYRSGDWLIREEDEHEYTRDSVSWNNTTGANCLIPSGYPFGTGNLPHTAFAAGNLVIVGLAINQVYVPNGETRKIALLRPNTHAIVNFDALPVASCVDGVVWNAANFLASLTASGFFIRREPLLQATQLTLREGEEEIVPLDLPSRNALAWTEFVRGKPGEGLAGDEEQIEAPTEPPPVEPEQPPVEPEQHHTEKKRRRR